MKAGLFPATLALSLLSGAAGLAHQIIWMRRLVDLVGANAWIEWDAGRNILGLATPWFVGIPCAEYVRNIQRASQPLLPPELRAAHDAGQFFLTLEVAAKLGLPLVANLNSQIPERTPAALRSDSGAKWQHWPMRIKPDFQPTCGAN